MAVPYSVLLILCSPPYNAASEIDRAMSRPSLRWIITPALVAIINLPSASRCAMNLWTEFGLWAMLGDNVELEVGNWVKAHAI